MKFYIVLFLWLTKNVFTYSQNMLSSPDSILNKISKELQNLKTLKYDNIRELNYSSENYHNISKWTIYYDFRIADTLTGFKYQIDDSTSKQIFNGTEKFELNNNAKTIQINDSPIKKSFSSLSALYNSIVTIRNILPLIITDKSVLKTIADTTINNKLYSLITINIGKRRIQNLGKGLDSMKTKNSFIYKLIVDKNSYLPIEVIQGNDINNDFIKTISTNIQLNPDPPSETSWYYSTYTNDYKTAAGVSTPQLLSNGSLPPDWKLKVYNESKMLSLSELKGNIVLIDFWIKNCGPCILSVPHLNELQNKFKGRKLKIISINSYDSKEDVSWFYNKHKIEYPVLLNGKEIAEKYGVSGFPTFFIVDKTGKIIYSHAGYGVSVQSEIERIIKNLL